MSVLVLRPSLGQCNMAWENNLSQPIGRKLSFWTLSEQGYCAIVKQWSRKRRKMRRHHCVAGDSQSILNVSEPYSPYLYSLDQKWVALYRRYKWCARNVLLSWLGYPSSGAMARWRRRLIESAYGNAKYIFGLISICRDYVFFIHPDARSLTPNLRKSSILGSTTSKFIRSQENNHV